MKVHNQNFANKITLKQITFNILIIFVEIKSLENLKNKYEKTSFYADSRTKESAGDNHKRIIWEFSYEHICCRVLSVYF